MGHGHAHGSRQPSCSEHPARTPGHPGVSRCTGEHGNGSRSNAPRPAGQHSSVRVPSTSTRSHTAPAPSAGATTDRVTVSPRRPRAPRSRCRARAGAATPSSFITASARTSSDPAGAAGLSRKVRATGGVKAHQCGSVGAAWRRSPRCAEGWGFALLLFVPVRPPLFTPAQQFISKLYKKSAALDLLMDKVRFTTLNFHDRLIFNPEFLNQTLYTLELTKPCKLLP